MRDADSVLRSKLHFGQSIERGAAAWYLSRHAGARVVARNFRCRQGELDLVLEEGGELVFVEVRARLEGSWQSGFESVGFVKQRRLVRAIQVFLSRYRGLARSVRVDVIAWDGNRWLHFRDLRDLPGA